MTRATRTTRNTHTTNRTTACARRAAIYRRISDDHDGTEKGIDRQLKDCRHIAKRKGWKVTAVYTENDVSASGYSRKIRVEFLRMMADLEAGVIDAVIVYNADRLVRQPKDLELLIDLAQQYDFEIEHEVGEVDLRTGQGKFLARILVAVAAAESDNTSRRIRAAMRDRAEKGLPLSGKRLFGYKVGRMELEPLEAEALCWARDEILDGATLYSVVKAFAAKGITTITGRPWIACNLSNLLLSEHLIGQRTYEGVTYPGTWPALFTVEEQAALRAELEQNQRKVGAPANHLLGGMLVCGKCGATLTGNRARGKYVCQECRGTTVRIADTDALITETFLKLMEARTSELTAEVAERRGAQLDGKAAHLHRIKAIDARLAELAGELERGEIIKAEWTGARAPLIEERAERAETVKMLTAESRRTRDGADEADPRGWWKDATVDQRRRALGLELEQVIVAPGQRGGRQAPLRDRLDPRWRDGEGD